MKKIQVRPICVGVSSEDLMHLILLVKSIKLEWSDSRYNELQEDLDALESFTVSMLKQHATFVKELPGEPRVAFTPEPKLVIDRKLRIIYDSFFAGLEMEESKLTKKDVQKLSKKLGREAWKKL